MRFALTRCFFRLQVDSGAVVCADAEIRGEVVIGAGSVVQPGAKLLAIGGPIVLGKNVVVDERAELVNRKDGAVLSIG